MSAILNTPAARPSRRQSFTLPVTTGQGFAMDPVLALQAGCALQQEYANAKPFPYAVFDDFLPNTLIEHALLHFPAEISLNDDMVATKHLQYLKRGINPIDCTEGAKALFYFFNSPAMLQFLEGLTGIQGLIPDPYFMGGGYHEIRRGGKLAVHADFRINKQLHLNRRLNVLIYLNKDWQAEYGGNLELWDQSMKNQEDIIEPLFNRSVIFNTDQKSYHGHPEALNSPAHITRKSIALYYYTASSAIYNEGTARGTYFNYRPQDDTATKHKIIRRKVRTHVREFLEDWLPPAITRFFNRNRR